MQYDFFYSDPHFGHTNIIKYCSRPFLSVDHMTEELVRRYNAVVGVEDSVLWLGDCFFGPITPDQILPRLAGSKWLLRGNHDKAYSDEHFIKAGFQAVFSETFLGRVEGLRVRFSHYSYAPRLRQPYPGRPRREPGVVLVHGHTHDKRRITLERTVHVGVDAWEYAPASRLAVYAAAKRALARRATFP